MISDFPAIVDACVLVQAAVRDTLLNQELCLQCVVLPEEFLRHLPPMMMQGAIMLPMRQVAITARIR